MSELQLKMNFAQTGNRFRQELDRGGFVLLIEVPAPSRANELPAVSAHLSALEKSVLAITSVNTALAITDRENGTDSWRAAEAATGLPEENRDRHLIYLSGKDTTKEEMRNLIRIAAGAGFRNFAAVSGNGLGKETARHPFTESVSTLQSLKTWPEGASQFFCGGVVNPFQYTPFPLMGQYYKLGKKFLNGAGFAVVQAGWDMLKLQSLVWYLNSRALYFPLIARLIWLTPERVEKILAGNWPGINISADFQKILRKELNYSVNQFEAAQLRRLELQAAGCRLLGFSGIQLVGADQGNRAAIAAERIAGALKEFTDFGQWLEEYNSYLASAEMAPFSRSFYLYDRVLHRTAPDPLPPANDLGPVQVSASEKTLYALRKFLFSCGEKETLLKRIAAGCSGSCQKCVLSKTGYVCFRRCPKKLLDGPCGGIRADGGCELDPSRECVHCRITRLAHWQGKLSQIESNTLTKGL